MLKKTSALSSVLIFSLLLILQIGFSSAATNSTTTTITTTTTSTSTTTTTTIPANIKIYITPTAPNLTIYGATGNSMLGEQMAVGDVNNDHKPDLIISASGASPPGGAQAGEVYVIFGYDYVDGDKIDLNAAKANLTIQGDNYGDFLGNGLASGDVNGDGIDDIIIGSPQSIVGKVYVIYGKAVFSNKVINLDTTPADIKILGENPYDYFGRRVAGGDINNDGIDDIIIGADGFDAPGSYLDGKVYVIYGKRNFNPNEVISLATTKANISIIGEKAQSGLGIDVLSEDVNNDGIKDVIAGSSYNLDSTYPGKVYVLFGNSIAGSSKVVYLKNTTTDLTIIGRQAGSRFGQSLSVADINNDVKKDLIIGAGSANSAYVIFGRPFASGTVLDLGSAPADMTIQGESSQDYMGESVASGDFNYDGINDIIVGARLADFNTTRSDAGKVYIIYGNNNFALGKTFNLLASSANVTFIEDDTRVFFGLDLVSANLNDIGGDELIVGSFFSSPLNRLYAGSVYVFTGTMPTTTTTTTSTTSTTATTTIASNSSVINLTNPGGNYLPPTAKKPSPFNLK